MQRIGFIMAMPFSAAISLKSTRDLLCRIAAADPNEEKAIGYLWTKQH